MNPPPSSRVQRAQDLLIEGRALVQACAPGHRVWLEEVAALLAEGDLDAARPLVSDETAPGSMDNAQRAAFLAGAEAMRTQAILCCAVEQGGGWAAARIARIDAHALSSIGVAPRTAEPR